MKVRHPLQSGHKRGFPLHLQLSGYPKQGFTTELSRMNTWLHQSGGLACPYLPHKYMLLFTHTHPIPHLAPALELAWSPGNSILLIKNGRKQDHQNQPIFAGLMSWTNLFSNHICSRAEAPDHSHNWDINLASQLRYSFKWAASQDKGHPMTTRRTQKSITAESKGSVDSTYPTCQGCFSNEAWQLSLDKVLWTIQKARTKEDKFCAVHNPHGSTSAQSRRPKSPVTQAWAWITFPGCLLAKPPCAFCMFSLSQVMLFLTCLHVSGMLIDSFWKTDLLARTKISEPISYIAVFGS